MSWELTYKDTLFLNTRLKICVTIYFLSTFNKKQREGILNMHHIFCTFVKINCELTFYEQNTPIVLLKYFIFYRKLIFGWRKLNI